MKFLLTLALALSACAPVTTVPVSQPVTTAPSGGIHFTAERVGTGTVRLALDNGSPEPIGYNLCSSELQRLDGAAWTPVATDEVCTMQIMTLNPGHDATFEKRLPSGLASGQYRYVTRVESPAGGAQLRLATQPFQL